MEKRILLKEKENIAKEIDLCFQKREFLFYLDYSRIIQGIKFLKKPYFLTIFLNPESIKV